MVAAVYYDKLPMNNTKKKKQLEIPNKFKNVSGFTFTTYNGELMMIFNGFEEEQDLPEFADFVFTKIRMRYYNSDKVPTIH